MSWRLVELAQVAPSPWRNGGGVTRELAAWPDAQDWVWRMSVAQVERGGPFSRFDGVRRWFAVLSGAGVRLELDGLSQELTRGSAPLAFDGATPVDCRLIDGATQDFNLMVRGDRPAQMTRLAGIHHLTATEATTVAVYALSAAAQITLNHETLTLPPQWLAWQTLIPGAKVQVDAAGALWMEISA